MAYLEQVLKDGHAEIVGEGKQQKVIYKAVDHIERYSDPEEQVRTEFWAELIYRYQYEPIRIGIEIVVPDRTPSDRADLVVFQDDERKRPYAVIECKRDGITDLYTNLHYSSSLRCRNSFVIPCMSSRMAETFCSSRSTLLVS